MLFTCAADEEAGSTDGARWFAVHRPDWLQAAGAVNECGGVSVTVAGRRLYPIQVAEKGFVPYRIHVRGNWGHGSMPREDNAAVLAAGIIERLAVPGPIRITPVMTRFLEAAADALPAAVGGTLRAIAAGELDPAEIDQAIDRLCDPMYARALRALIRDTLSPDVVHAGVKYNVIPGDATIDVDCRILPGTIGGRHVRRGRGADRRRTSCPPAASSGSRSANPSRRRPRATSGTRWSRRCATTTPTASRSRSWRPFATDAKATAMVGTPTYGFSPFRLEPDERFLERFHGVDERISLDALRFGLPVLYDVVRRFCG